MKEKRKEQPYNARRYWLIFSVLTILLLIPFRIVGYWGLTYIIYAVISVVMFAVLVRFVRRYSWRKWIVSLMLICVLLPIFQVSQNSIQDDCYKSDNAIFNFVSCQYDCIVTEFIVLKGTSFGIHIGQHPPYNYFCFF